MTQKGRMNSGWRYQYLAVSCARQSRRFRSVSDIGAAEADFNAVIDFLDRDRQPLSLYVSVKNRKDTLGGQDWPKAISALETVASSDKNRTGPYLCVFGIAMDRGLRLIKTRGRGQNKEAYSANTELWASDYFWPFFANYSYEDVMLMVLNVLMETEDQDDLPSQVQIPEPIIDAFGTACKVRGLIDSKGYFDDPQKLVKFFVGK